MKTLIAFIAALSISTPVLAQRVNYAPRMVKLGDTIQTSNHDAAKRLCHSWGGDHLAKHPVYGWDCFRLIR